MECLQLFERRLDLIEAILQKYIILTLFWGGKSKGIPAM